MKKKTKRSLACVAFILILAIFLLVTSYLFAPLGNQEDFGIRSAAANAILDEKENTIDILVLGDSGTYASVSPMQLWKDHGMTAYVCATSAQYLSLSDVLLKQAFEKQNPKIVVLEAYTIYRKMRFNISITNRIEGLFSIFKFHNRWKAVGRFEALSFLNTDITDDFKGYRHFTGVVPVEESNFDNPTDEIMEILPLNEEYVKSMAEYCRENGAQLVLVNIPNAKYWSYAKHNGIQQLADTYGIPYIDLNTVNDVVGIDWQSDTIDMGDHLNYSGAKKASKYLGDYLAENFALPDHRGDVEYLDWDEALERYLYAVEK
ncbi:MAG: hypothetical protein J1E05_08125 [Eubacterium sp.]|nr:hypothetical protein [Eubacterium sp.]